MYQAGSSGTRRIKRGVAPEGHDERGSAVGATEGRSNEADGARIQVIRAADWSGVVERVTEAGGRVLCVHAESVLVVELPAGVSAADIGADEVEERRRSRWARGVTATWRPVAAAC